MLLHLVWDELGPCLWSLLLPTLGFCLLVHEVIEFLSVTSNLCPILKTPEFIVPETLALKLIPLKGLGFGVHMSSGIWSSNVLNKIIHPLFFSFKLLFYISIPNPKSPSQLSSHSRHLPPPRSHPLLREGNASPGKSTKSVPSPLWDRTKPLPLA